MVEDSSAESDPKEVAFDAERDWLLSDLVEMHNSQDGDLLSLPITLMVNGMLISGRLISGGKYFDYYGDFWAATVPDEHKEETKSHFGGAKDLYGPEGQRSSTPNFIHLADARIYSAGGNPIPNNMGMNWRGKIASVDGFWIGNLEVGNN